MPRTLVVGDIHGCFDEFLALLEKAEITERDRVVSVGDLIDRGPKSAEVVRYFAERPGRFFAVRGNHEEKHIQNQEGSFPTLAGWIVRRTTEGTAYKSMLRYLATLPCYLDLGEAIVVHAGLAPSIELAEQNPKVLMGVGSAGRTGFDGRSSWWYDSPALSTAKPIIYGHEKHPEVVRGTFGNVWGIDTGAGMGGPLTGLILPEFRLVSVPVPDYWATQQQVWRPLFRGEKLPYLSWDDLLAQNELPETGSGAEAERLREMLADFHSAGRRIETERSHFIQKHSYQELEGKEKGDLIRRMKEQAKMLDPDQAALYRCVLESLPNRDVAAILKERFPNWATLKESVIWSLASVL